MNWEHAKNWLIAAFLGLDIFLFWQLMAGRAEMLGYAESYSDLLANTKTVLAEHGFTLNAKVPQAQPDMPTFQASFADPKHTTLWHTVFPEAIFAKLSDNGQVIHTEEGKLQFLTSGTWQVTYSTPRTLSNPSDGLKYIHNGGMYQLDTALSGAHAVTYDENYDTYPIFDISTVFELSNAGLNGFTQSEIDNIHVTGTAKPVISALDALNSLANSVDKSSSQADNKILNVDLGYARKVAVEPFSNSSATGNYWFPVWRVVTNQQIYFINALTGEVD